VSGRKLVKITRESEHSPHPIDQDSFPLKDALRSPLVVHELNSEEEEQDWIASQVANDIEQGMNPLDLMITGPTGHRERQYYQGMQNSLNRYGIKSLIAGVDTDPDVFQQDGYVTISPIFRAKGNEAWKVYACRFHYADDPVFQQEEELHKRNQAFVALTRARVWCVVTGEKSPIFQELRAIQQDYPNLVFPAFNRAALRRNNDDDENETLKENVA
ncbi:MAG: ATP-binding domain-containing protein, partial [Symploca sp. SIO3C6]|nr:ATP-binding domain-containing protein [Symploca sp. SIO3C6]